MNLVTRRMLRRWLVNNILIDANTKDVLLSRLANMVGQNQINDDVFKVNDDVTQVLVEEYEALEEQVKWFDWNEIAKPEDFRAISRFERHQPRRPTDVQVELR